MPRQITWNGNEPKGRMTLLDGRRKLSYSTDRNGVTRVNLPKGVKAGPLAIKFRKR